MCTTACVNDGQVLQGLVCMHGHLATGGAAERAAVALANVAYGSEARKHAVNALDAANFLRPLLRHSSSSLAKRASTTLESLGH